MEYPALRLMIKFAMLYIALTGSVGASEVVQEWTPTPADVASVEATLSMPQGAASLKQYIRYYAGTLEKGHRVLLGHFELGPTYNGADGDVRVVKSKNDLPVVFDGGCSILFFRYDMTEKRVVNLRCNGIA